MSLTLIVNFLPTTNRAECFEHFHNKRIFKLVRKCFFLSKKLSNVGHLKAELQTKCILYDFK